MFNVDNLVVLPLNGALILILIKRCLALLADLIPAGRQLSRSSSGTEKQ